VLVVDHVDLEVPDGSFVVLLGPSGCGKTTTLRCIAGMETPDSGDIFIGEKRVNKLQPKERDVAMVFQNYALYPHMTVYQNMAFPLRMRHVAKNEIDSRVKEVAKLLNIDRLLQRKPKQLSGGEQQRTALGRAIVRRPKLFLMDEPLSNLDAKLRFSTRTEIKRIQKEIGTTTVYVTHDQAEAMALADKVGVMNKGKILQYDPPGQLYLRPKTTFVAGFMGSPPMNLIKASLVEKSDGIMVLDAGKLKYTVPATWYDTIKNNVTGPEVYLGIHPEDLKISTSPTAETIFEADVYLVEPVGANILVDIKVDGSIFKAISPPLTLNLGQKVYASFPDSKAHVFDAKTEQLII
jgi:multiple sugar transport system ATP-binding protein